MRIQLDDIKVNNQRNLIFKKKMKIRSFVLERKDQTVVATGLWLKFPNIPAGISIEIWHPESNTYTSRRMPSMEAALCMRGVTTFRWLPDCGHQLNADNKLEPIPTPDIKQTPEGLTQTESVLYTVLKRKGHATRQELMSAASIKSTNSLDTHISNLRKKIATQNETIKYRRKCYVYLKNT